MIIISASGMLSGGRVLHHLLHRAGDPRNTILIVGFQPPGGIGARLLAGDKSVTIYRQEIDVNAEVAEISGLSAHGDRDELLRWCREGSGTPERVMVVHGEPSSAEAFSLTLKREFGWNAAVASYYQKLHL
jgi:metallo-beta-lactamase family protein